jgi:fructoselysine-6-P-deglycase FrlB-like protein
VNRAFLESQVNTAVGAALEMMLEDMERQIEDGRESFARAGEVAAALADAMRRSGRLILLGMGASHAANRVAEVLYRRAGIDATAVAASEMLSARLEPSKGTVILTSQSGESGEIVAYLGLDPGDEDRFGLTLNRDSTLAKTLPSLVGYGGMEQAFAATRSLYVSLALHARVLHELGVLHEPDFDLGRHDCAHALREAESALSRAPAVIFSGSGALQGIAEAAALMLVELARMPALAFESGQFRHGPLEALGPELGVVLIRQADAAAEPIGALAQICRDAGSPTVLVDLSGLQPTPGVSTIPLPKAADMEAALAILPPLQSLVISMAKRRVADVGAPVRSAKIMTGV